MRKIVPNMRSLAVNKFTITCLVLATGVLTALLTAQTPAPAPTKVGIVHLQAAIMSTKDGQAAIADLQKTLREPKTKELEGKQQDIKDLQEKLQRGSNTMSETAKTDLQKQITQKTKLLNYAVEDFQAEADEAESKVLDELVTKMKVVIGKYAQDNGYRVILDVTNPNSGVLFWTNDADLTAQLTDAYDKMYPAGSSAAKAPASKGSTPVKQLNLVPTPAKTPPPPAPSK